MKKKPSYFDQLCELSYMCLLANHPAMLRTASIRRDTKSVQ